MSYASQQDLIDRFGEQELIQLSDRLDPPSGQIHAPTVTRALADADAEINGYIAARVATPVDPVPGILNQWACAIARYRLAKDLATDRMRQDYQDAITWLKAFAAGNASLGDSTAPTQTSSAGKPVMEAPERIFTRDSLKGSVMSGIGITISIDVSPVTDLLGRLAAFSDHLSPALDAIGAAMVTATALRFDTGTAPDGSTWPPSQRVKKKGGKTLILSGRLWHSLTHNVLGNAVEWGTNVIYAAIQQLGGTITREPHVHTIYRKASKDGIEPGFVKKAKSNFAQDVAVKAFNITIPARPFIGINQEDVAEIRDVLVRYLNMVAQ